MSDWVMHIEGNGPDAVVRLRRLKTVQSFVGQCVLPEGDPIEIKFDNLERTLAEMDHARKT
jgi:hypothetical protein